MYKLRQQSEQTPAPSFCMISAFRVQDTNSVTTCKAGGAKATGVDRMGTQLSQTETETACKKKKKSGGGRRRDRKCNVDHLASSTKSHFVQLQGRIRHGTPCLLSWQIFPPDTKAYYLSGEGRWPF